MSKLKIRFYVLIFILTILMSGVLIANSYGLFETGGEANIEQDLAKWVIKINKNLATGNTQSFIIDKFNYDSNGYINDDKLAPGGNCYFDLVLDATDTNVSVKYTIDFDFSEVENYNFIEAHVINMNGNTIIKTGENQYTGLIDVEDIEENSVNTIRIELLWPNDDENNERDSILGLTENLKISVPISINFVQYLGEEITEF